MNEPRLPLLGGLAATWRWLEELANTLASPAITVGLGIALIDLLTGGDLLHAVPWLLFVWAAAQAVGVDAQLPGAASHARRAWRDRRWLALAGYLLLAGAVAYVATVAALVFSYREAYHLTTDAALARLGFDATTWLVQRAVFSVAVAFVAAFTRYESPTAAAAHLDERARLEREAELLPLRAHVRAQKMLGVVHLARRAASAMTGRDEAGDEDDHPPLPRPEFTPWPTGPGTPGAARPGAGSNPNTIAPPVRLTRRPRKTRSTRTASAERKARAAWRPGMTVGQLERATGMGRSTASKWHAILRAEPPERMAQ